MIILDNSPLHLDRYPIRPHNHRRATRNNRPRRKRQPNPRPAQIHPPLETPAKDRTRHHNPRRLQNPHHRVQYPDVMRLDQSVEEAPNQRRETAAASEQDQAGGVERWCEGEGDDKVGEDEGEAGPAGEPEVFGKWGHAQAGEAEGAESRENYGECEDEGGAFEG